MERTIFYSDQFIITENENGFVFNFFKDKSDIEDKIDYGFSIGMSPLPAKELLLTLFSAIGEYESKYGEIKVNPSIVRKIIAEKPNPIGFKAPKIE